MTKLADIFRQFGSLYIAKYQDRMLPSHLKTMRDVLLCRTELLGGRTWLCRKCNKYHYSYHSCKNRHCPNCQNEKSQAWLETQQSLLLPVEYFMATFTLPEALRKIARSKQKQMYHLFFTESAQALLMLAKDPKYLGANIGITGVLQTWTRMLTYHPHIHYLIPGGGISDDGAKWIKAKDNFLMHVKPLSRIFKAKFRDAVKKAGLYDQIPKKVWKQKWVVHLESVGSGEATLKYLAPYVSRVAISNLNIVSCKGGKVTFRYKQQKSGIYKTIKLDALEFIRRFLQHTLPKGFQKIRMYGFLSSKKKDLLEKIKSILKITLDTPLSDPDKEKVFKCPVCGSNMFLVDQTPRMRGPPLYALLSKKNSM